MMPRKGWTQTAAISHAGAVCFVWALWQLCLPGLVLNFTDFVHSYPILVLRNSWPFLDQKTDLAASSKGFLLAQDGEQDCMAGNAGSGKERWETHWLYSTWSLGKDRVIWERTEGSAWLVGLDTLLSSLKCLNCIVIIIIIITVITL